jgi:pyruvate kinase
MLSGETASGKYPRESVNMMARIIVETETNILQSPALRRRSERRELSISEAICESVAHVAEDLNMRAIAVYTESGNTARLISKYRPRTPIFAFAHNPPVCQRLNLYWGVRPVLTSEKRSVETMVELADAQLLKAGIVVPGDIVGVVAGTHTGSGSTNLIRLHRVVGKNARKRK